MGYMHIENLYREEAQSILLFKELYEMEKIHGTSAHIGWRDGKLTFFAGGCPQATFEALFDKPKLTELFYKKLGHCDVVVFGEAYGGKMQGMAHTYGPKLKFIAFDIKVGETWLNVPSANEVALKLGLEFVQWSVIPCDIAIIDASRDLPSRQAKINGVAGDHKAEGVVLRPLVEFRDNRGNRVIAKHKTAGFCERKTPQQVDAKRKEVMDNADAIAFEFVTDMRMNHVLDKLNLPYDWANIPAVISAMIEDVTREASGEIIDNKDVRKAIGKATVAMYKKGQRELQG